MPASIVRIYSENNAFQYVETLRRNRKKRTKNREFFVEGVRAINQAIAYGWKFTAFYYTTDRRLSGWANDVLEQSKARTHYELPAELMDKLSNKTDPSELIATIAMPADDLSRIPLSDNPLFAIFDRPASPGNLGTIIRSCDALGIEGLVITGHAADLYDPETINATTGSFFAVPVVRLPSQRELMPWLNQIRQQYPNFQMVGTSAKATVNIDQHDFTVPTALVLGNETWGMSAAYRESCDHLVTIPIRGSATSLNVANAASIMFYEIDRQRRLAK
jgi:tRNA G18 (ribose-2'-O)-methylase SpoU